MTKQQFIDWALTKGYSLDRFGHLQKDKQGKKYRYKVNTLSVRYEVKGDAGWTRLRSNYYKNLKIDAENKLMGLRFAY